MSIVKWLRYLAIALISVAAVYWYAYGIKPAYSTCESETKNLSGQHYKIQICNAGGDDRTGFAILRVLSMQDELLAEVTVEYAHGTRRRDAVFFVEEEHRIGYIGKNDSVRSISIPPTGWDWILARLP